MRSQKLFFVATLAACALAALLVGCSKDSSPVTPPVSDNGFNAVQSEFTNFADSLVAQFGVHLDAYTTALAGDIQVAYSPINPDSTVLADGGWHVVYASDLIAGYDFYLVDSIRFLSHGNVQNVALGADQMHVIRRWGVQNPDTTADYRNIEVASSFLFGGLNSDTATVWGGRQATLHTKQVTTAATVKRTYEIAMVATGIVIPKSSNGWTKGCPQSGSINGTIVQTVDDGNVPVTTSWNYEVTATAGVLDGTVTAGSWTKTFTAPLCQM